VTKNHHGGRALLTVGAVGDLIKLPVDMPDQCVWQPSVVQLVCEVLALVGGPPKKIGQHPGFASRLADKNHGPNRAGNGLGIGSFGIRYRETKVGGYLPSSNSGQQRSQRMNWLRPVCPLDSLLDLQRCRHSFFLVLQSLRQGREDAV
jgi:hypothetical protein